MYTKAFPSGPFQTNAYVVACTKTKQAAIIDPAPDSAESIIDFLDEKQWQPIKILLTHSHWDHIADVSILKEKYLLPVYIHPLDKPNLKAPGADGLPCWIPITGVSDTIDLHENDEIPIGKLNFNVIFTPGHTPGGVCFYEKQQKVLFSGDTLFQGTIGNLSFPTARPGLMWSSLDKLAKLPPDTIVYPGHGPQTTIGAESSWLPHAKRLFSND